MYVWDSYWGTWSRVLGTTKFHIVKLSLTTSNYEWNKVRKEWIRAHYTSPSPKDERQNFLPSAIIERLDEKVGERLRRRLMTVDYFSQIDWEEYSRVCNGGASFWACCRL